MERIFRLITSYTEEQSEDAVKRFSDYELKEILDLADSHQFYSLKYNGEVCHWREGELEYVIIFCDEKTIKKFKDFDERAHIGMEGYTHIDDITDDVLLDRFDTSVFGFFKLEMEYDFFQYRLRHLTKDHILDKILMYGKDSLSENEKLFLEDKEMKSPIDDL